jgi:DNA-binding PadR family transcriptional regulator
MDPGTFLPLTNLAFEILLALGEGPRHGYAVIRDIEDRTGGEVRLRSGTLYTAIQRLQASGLLAESGARPAPDRDDQRRRYYEITELGRQVARLEAARLAGLVQAAQRRNLLGTPPPASEKAP